MGERLTSGEKRPLPRVERTGNISTVYKENGTYSFIYGGHGYSNDFLSKPADYSYIPSGTDVLFFENAYNWLSGHNVSSLISYMRDSSFRHQEVNMAEKKELVSGFMDPAVHSEWNAVLDFTTSGLLVGTGAVLLDKPVQEKVSRRKFLKMLVSGLGVYFALPLVASAGVIASDSLKQGEKSTAEFFSLVGKIEPQFLFLVLGVRNTVVAHKLNWLMEQKGGKLHFTHDFGALHLGVEDKLLQTPEERIAFLKKTKALWQPFFVKETFYSIATADFKDKQWKDSPVLEVPELKALVA